MSDVKLNPMTVLMLNGKLNELTEQLLKEKKTDKMIVIKEAMQEIKTEIEFYKNNGFLLSSSNATTSHGHIGVTSISRGVNGYTYDLSKEAKNVDGLGAMHPFRLRYNIEILGEEVARLQRSDIKGMSMEEKQKFALTKMSKMSEYNKKCEEYNFLHGNGGKIMDEELRDFSGYLA